MNDTIQIACRRCKHDNVPDAYVKAIEESCVRELFDKAHYEVFAFDVPYTIKLRREQHRDRLQGVTIYDYVLEITKVNCK